MCGILGISTTNPSPDLNQRLAGALEALRHRGPDNQGLETFSMISGKLVLGHTRLSIIDLSPGGHQPMHSPDRRYTIVYNGEIYNYLELRKELRTLGHNFRTNSDTEVLLAAWAQWGVDGLRRLVGMFAFAVFDSIAQTLTMVRDAFGIKPLFYACTPEGILFASEIPALLKLMPRDPELNLQRVYEYLVSGVYDNGSDTFFKGAKHLLPGHWLTFDFNDHSLKQPVRWWWPSIEERTDLSFEDATAQLRDIFLNNVRLQLRSDVPLGAALSGGIDSSALVCAMRHLEPDMPIHTFSFVARDSDMNEERWADIVNAHVGAIAHKVVVEPAELAQDLDDMIRAQGEPFGGTSIYAQYRVYKAAREAGIIVTLDGQGADELLAGYHGYPQFYLRSLQERHRYLEIPSFLNAWARWPGRSQIIALRNFAWLVMSQRSRRLVRRLLGRSHSPPEWINQTWLAQRHVNFSFSGPKEGESLSRGRRLIEQLRNELTGNGLPSLLRHGDRNSMRWSIESRVPFLTIEMAEFLLRLPEKYLVSPKGETKHIFRAAMRGIVPDEILDRGDKIGFRTPAQAWLLRQQYAIKNWLSAADDLPFLYGDSCYNEVEQIINGHKPFNNRAWRLINYCRWARLP